MRWTVPVTIPSAARRREKPRNSRAAQCKYEFSPSDYEFSPSDVDCHATPTAGGRVHAIERTISRFSE